MLLNFWVWLLRFHSLLGTGCPETHVPRAHHMVTSLSPNTAQQKTSTTVIGKKKAANPSNQS